MKVFGTHAAPAAAGLAALALAFCPAWALAVDEITNLSAITGGNGGVGGATGGAGSVTPAPPPGLWT